MLDHAKSIRIPEQKGERKRKPEGTKMESNRVVWKIVKVTTTLMQLLWRCTGTSSRLKTGNWIQQRRIKFYERNVIRKMFNSLMTRG